MGESRRRGEEISVATQKFRAIYSTLCQFLTTFIISLLKAIDIRSESSVKLLAEFLDMDRPYTEYLRFPNAEHFAHGQSLFCQFVVTSDDLCLYRPSLIFKMHYRTLFLLTLAIQELIRLRRICSGRLI